MGGYVFSQALKHLSHDEDHGSVQVYTTHKCNTERDN